MKYCPRCKLRAKDEETVCSSCGGQLRVVGEQAPKSDAGGANAVGEEQLRLKLAGLQHQVERAASSVRRLAILAGLLTLILIVLLVTVRAYYVRQFATLGRVAMAPSEVDPSAVEITYEPLSGGKVEFVRETAGRRETLTDYADPAGTDESEKHFVWSGGEEDEYTVWVRYRSGWGLVRKEWSPEVNDKK